MNFVSYLLGAGSALLVGLSKTGLPGVSIPAVTLMTEAFAHDARLGVGALLPVLLVGDVFAVGWYRHHALWSKLVRLFPFVLLGMVPGAIVLCSLPEGNDLRPILGVLILGLLALEMARRTFGWEDVPKAWWFVAGLGMLAGFSTIIAHAAFPVMTIYLLSQGMAKREFVGTAAWFFFIVNLSKLPFYVGSQMITPSTLRFDLVTVPVVLAGGVLGICMLPRLPQKLFDFLAMTLAALAAVRLLTA